MNKRIKDYISTSIILIIAPLALAVSYFLLGTKAFIPSSILICALAVISFILRFEKKKSDVSVIVIISVMSALAIAGRILFTPFPGLKPVSAIIILCAVYMGSESGFLCGVLVSAVSNFYFGHGPWSALQMMIWGLIGFFAGVLSKKLSKSTVWLCVYGGISGIAFSLVMDVWTVIWTSGGLSFSQYGQTLIYAAGFTALYSVSNVIFLIILKKPVGGTLERLKTKYGIGI